MSDSNLPTTSIQARHSIWRMYRDAADHDYLLARFSARSNLIYQFWWNAQQAVEKYLKAALLLNGMPTSSYRHRLSKMFEIAQDFSGDLLPILHCPPRCVVRRSWPDTNPRAFLPVSIFVSRIEQNGNPDNRYRVFSTYTRSADLVYFDELCFVLRRIAFPLELQLEEQSVTAREALSNHRGIQLHPNMGFEGHLEKKREDVWGDHFRWCNFAYFYEDALNKAEYPSWGGAINAEPYMAINGASETGLAALTWIAQNGFPKTLRKNILNDIDEARKSRAAKPTLG